MVLASAYDKQCPFPSAFLKNWRHAGTNGAIILDLFTWKPFSDDRHLYLNAIKWQRNSDIIQKQLLNLFKRSNIGKYFAIALKLIQSILLIIKF